MNVLVKQTRGLRRNPISVSLGDRILAGSQGEALAYAAERAQERGRQEVRLVGGTPPRRNASLWAIQDVR